LADRRIGARLSDPYERGDPVIDEERSWRFKSDFDILTKRWFAMSWSTWATRGLQRTLLFEAKLGGLVLGKLLLQSPGNVDSPRVWTRSR